MARVMVRDINAVRRELAAYPDEASVWALPPGIANSAGSLALHIAGNLQHFIGAVLGGSGYKRDRAAEFAKRNVPRSALIVELEAAIVAIGLGMSQVSDARLAEEFPEAIAGHRIVTGEWLIHLVSHLAYHLGQIDYHRRLVTQSGATVGAMAVPELGTARKVA
ncbi:MAG TPA: DinB family protein [Myxococcaceae bacterium]|nr:DinB family protein [Myxococcaceae bacterium]